jgi:hypothetical protein
LRRGLDECADLGGLLQRRINHLFEVGGVSEVTSEVGVVGDRVEADRAQTG